MLRHFICIPILLLALPLFCGCPCQGKAPYEIARDSARFTKVLTVIVENHSEAEIGYSVSYKQQDGMPPLYLDGDIRTGKFLHDTGPRKLSAGTSDTYHIIYYSEEDSADAMLERILREDFALTFTIPGAKPRTCSGLELLGAHTAMDGRLQAVLQANASSAHLTITM